MKRRPSKRRFRIWDETARKAVPLPRRSYASKDAAVHKALLLIYQARNAFVYTVHDEWRGKQVTSFRRGLSGVVEL